MISIETSLAISQRARMLRMRRSVVLELCEKVTGCVIDQVCHLTEAEGKVVERRLEAMLAERSVGAGVAAVSSNGAVWPCASGKS